MNSRNNRRSVLLAALVSSLFATAQSAKATVVEFQTVMGNFEVNLYDNATPETVANFLNYVNNMAYSDSVIHRSMPGFVIQGGGFTFNDQNLSISAIAQNAAVVNEPVYSNVTGTIAMAKLGNDANSATNQWFFNLANNSANLDEQNGGFTVFGEVIGDGMDILNLIEALPTIDTTLDNTLIYPSAFTDVPLQGNTENNPFDQTNFVIITDVIVTDSAEDSAGVAGLDPAPNTLINEPPTPAPEPATPPPALGGGGGGGSIGFLALFGLLLGYRCRKT
jgi:peptidyl-prolyl cis-trans isomerase A (cyclophilin A)